MQVNMRETRQYLKESNFEPLFREALGWDYCTQTLPVRVDDTEWTLTAIAQKRGMVVFECPATEAADGRIPDYGTRRKIQKQAAASAHEHFIIYTSTDKTTQLWQYVKRQQGKPEACREHRYNTKEHTGESLIQKLQAIVFTLDAEAELGLFDVISSVQTAFDVEKVTKRFYDHFKQEHTTFLKFLNGIPDEDMQKWYVSVMLNRLMFIYFIQKKGFLDNNEHYLQAKLIQSQAAGTNRYYKAFLCPLFFEGFAKPEAARSREVKQLLGKVPYLNGGIFQKHQLETLHGETLEIPDRAFEGIFKFFEQYQWHLDDRPLRNDTEINPDVLGYIFEKYINQKQMGAYYTKEDITEYISKNTIVPFLFDRAKKACKIAFEGDASVWRLLQDDPDRYIYDAVKKGVEVALPAHIAAGIDDISKREASWNTLADADSALPTELWRETVARRERYEALRAKLANGDIANITDLITYNLNIRQFAQDVIEHCEGPDLLRAFYKAITEVTILDPTCGSGAFLFAAVNILEPLYEACLDRMEVFLAEGEVISGSGSSRRYSDFRGILDKIEDHPNRAYFILKSIIVNNLYGVDIMEEAVEICKLRLFLKMVAKLADVRRMEPLPDIDFNIQSGNTLVGYATYDEVQAAVTGQLDFDDTMLRIDEKVEDIERLFYLFRQQQTELGGAVLPADKQALQAKLQALAAELNGYLAGAYQIDRSKESVYQDWLNSHKPFHWFIAFYGILKRGGFDVIIGNPPYVEYRKVKDAYAISGYETQSCGNLYVFVCERSFRLLQPKGWKSMIIPNSAFSTDRMAPLQNLFYQLSLYGWIQTYGIRPAKLFVGAEQRLAIYILSSRTAKSDKRKPIAVLCASRYHRWHELFRSHLFAVAEYADVREVSFQNTVPKIHSEIEQRLWKKLSQFSVLGKCFSQSRTPDTIYFHNSPRYWIRAMDFAPYFWNARQGERVSSSVKPLSFAAKLDASVGIAVLNSSLFFWWWVLLSDCRRLDLRKIEQFPIGMGEMETGIKQVLSRLSADLMVDLKRHAQRKETYYKTTGRVIYDEFYPRHSKHVIDEIDRVLAGHYSFTDEELDFISNYDIKYRMGLGN